MMVRITDNDKINYGNDVINENDVINDISYHNDNKKPWKIFNHNINRNDNSADNIDYIKQYNDEIVKMIILLPVKYFLIMIRWEA